MPTKVLIAHGNTQRLKKAVADLQAAGLSVTATPDGGDAFARFFEDEPSLVICSESLPSLEGRAFAQMVRSQSPQTPVVLLQDSDGEQENADWLTLPEPLDVAAVKEALPDLFVDVEAVSEGEGEGPAYSGTHVFVHAALRRFQRDSNLLGSLDSKGLHLMADIAKHQIYEADDAVVKQGEAGDGFYLVVEGQVRVTLEEKGDEEVARIGPGGFFGEMAMLSDTRRTASVYMAGEGTLLWFPRSGFLPLLDEYPGLREVLSGVAHTRREDNLWSVLFDDKEVQQSFADLDEPEPERVLGELDMLDTSAEEEALADAFEVDLASQLEGEEYGEHDVEIETDADDLSHFEAEVDVAAVPSLAPAPAARPPPPPPDELAAHAPEIGGDIELEEEADIGPDVEIQEEASDKEEVSIETPPEAVAGDTSKEGPEQKKEDTLTYLESLAPAPRAQSPALHALHRRSAGLGAAVGLAVGVLGTLVAQSILDPAGRGDEGEPVDLPSLPALLPALRRPAGRGAVDIPRLTPKPPDGAAEAQGDLGDPGDPGDQSDEEEGGDREAGELEAMAAAQADAEAGDSGQQPAETAEPALPKLRTFSEAERKAVRKKLLKAYKNRNYPRVVQLGYRLRDQYRLDWEAKLFLGNAERETGDFEAALDTYRGFTEAYPTNVNTDDVHYAIGEILLGLGDRTNARTHLRRVAQDPESEKQKAAEKRLQELQ